AQRCAVLVGGDSLAERKPHPMPLLHAAAALGLAPGECAYVGADRRDIDAARAAGMASVVALWGYRPDDDDPVAWQGATMVEAPERLLEPEDWPVGGAERRPGAGNRSTASSTSGARAGRSGGLPRRS